MQVQRNKSKVLITSMLSMMFLCTACQPKQDQKKEEQTQSRANPAVAKESINDLILSKTITITLPQPRVCDESGCTDYEVQTVETNHQWINDYFMARIKKADPVAFETSGAREIKKDVAERDLNLSSTVVRYVGQNQNLATFAMTSFSYTAGAAHGMYHQEFVNFDLSKKKRIALQDLIANGSESKILENLYSANSTWLDAHNVSQDKLKLSDNFYYGANGIVFVYPLYELASYAEGMSELVLPYQMLDKLIKPEYLPNLPNYKAS